VTPDGRLVDASQTSLVLALHFGLLERAERKHALDMLVADIKQRNTHIATGMLGTPFLLHVLTAGGQLGLAYELLLQTSSPGWLFPVTQGATTIWERWDGWTNEAGFADASMNSFNHCAFGAVGEWLYQTVAGLDLNPDLAPEKNAYRHAHIEPQPPVGKDFPAGPPLRYAEARLDTVHGRFSSRWEITDDLFQLNVCVPTNCTATVVLPDGRSEELCSGDHEFEVRLERDAQIPVLDLNRRVS
jgi:alpha-L-rhamnosidase